MEEKGIVLELRRKEAVVINNKGQYKRITRVKGMFLGQMVVYRNEAIVPFKFYKYIATASGIAALLVCMFFSYTFFIKNVQPKVFAYIDIDINPSMEFSIDDDNRVISLEPLNSDAEKVVGSLDLKNEDINIAVMTVIDKLEDTGFITPQKKNMILISSSSINKEGLSKVQIDSNNLRLNKTISTLKETILKKKNGMVAVNTIKLSPKVEKPEKDNKISIGRYVLYKNAVKKGVKITQDEAKRIPLNELIEKTGNSNNTEIVEDDSNSKMVSVNTENAENKGNKENKESVGNNIANSTETANSYEGASKEGSENDIDDKKPKPAHEDKKPDGKKPKEHEKAINKGKSGKDKGKNEDKNIIEVGTNTSSYTPTSTVQPTAENVKSVKEHEHNELKNNEQLEEKQKENTDDKLNEEEKHEEKNVETTKPKPEAEENEALKPTPKPALEPSKETPKAKITESPAVVTPAATPTARSSVPRTPPHPGAN